MMMMMVVEKWLSVLMAVIVLSLIVDSLASRSDCYFDMVGHIV